MCVGNMQGRQQFLEIQFQRPKLILPRVMQEVPKELEDSSTIRHPAPGVLRRNSFLRAFPPPVSSMSQQSSGRVSQI